MGEAVLLGTAAKVAATSAVSSAGLAMTVPVVTTAATSGLFGTAGAFSLMSTLSTLGTVFGGVTSIFGGLKGQQISNQQAAFQDMQAEQELIKGLQSENDIREARLRTIASNIARFGASGVDVGSGSPVSVNEEIDKQAERQLGTTRDNAAIASATRRIGALQSREEGKLSVTRGLGGAAQSLITLATR